MPTFTTTTKPLYYTDNLPSSSTSKSTLLLIHGLGSSSSFYFPIIPTLTSAGHRVITLDTHGSGQSPYTGTGNSISSISTDIIELLDGLNVKDAVLVGHSMGAIVASTLAGSAEFGGKGRAKGVVLIGPVNPNPEAADVFTKRIEVVKTRMHSFPLLSFSFRFRDTCAWNANVLIEGMEPLASTIPTSATGSLSTPLVHAFIRQLVISSNPAGYASLCNAIATAPLPDYSAIKAPLLLLAGEEDKSAPLTGCEAIFKAYGTETENKQLIVLPGVGHWHVLEAPEMVGGALVKFVEGL
jgi:pimeloyl-ACP methyl ester carboxylesterase